MNHEARADAVCQAMGLGGLRKPDASEPQSWLRVVLLPSFHPEVSITISAAAVGVGTVIALHDRCTCGGYVQSHSAEQLQVDECTVGEAMHQFREARQPQAECCGMLVLDGLAASACLVSGDVEVVHGHISTNNCLRRLVETTLRSAWDGCASPGIRNSLAQCGSYLNLDLPLQSIPPAPAITRVGLLGDPRDTRVLLNALRQRRSQPDPD